MTSEKKKKKARSASRVCFSKRLRVKQSRVRRGEERKRHMHQTNSRARIHSSIHSFIHSFIHPSIHPSARPCNSPGEEEYIHTTQPLLFPVPVLHHLLQPTTHGKHITSNPIILHYITCAETYSSAQTEHSLRIQACQQSPSVSQSVRRSAGIAFCALHVIHTTY